MRRIDQSALSSELYHRPTFDPTTTVSEDGARLAFNLTSKYFHRVSCNTARALDMRSRVLGVRYPSMRTIILLPLSTMLLFTLSALQIEQ